MDALKMTVKTFIMQRKISRF